MMPIDEVPMRDLLRAEAEVERLQTVLRAIATQAATSRERYVSEQWLEATFDTKTWRWRP